MKKILLPTAAVGAASVLALAAILAGGVAGGAADPAPDLETVSLEVHGMESFLCEIGVKSALKSVDGVRAVEVDRSAERAEVRFDPAVAEPAQLLAAVAALGYRAAVAGGGGQGAALAEAPAAAHDATPSRLTPEEIDSVVAYVVERLVAGGAVPTGDEIEQATGVALEVADVPFLQRQVVARLAADPQGRSLLAGSRCSDYGACSLWGNLAGASGEVLATYDREKANDGQVYEDFALPAVSARDLSGAAVSTADLAGRPALVALFAVHCTHSIDSLPILQEIERRHGGDGGLRVVSLWVNSGTVADANAWLPHFQPEYEVWVADDDSLSEAVDSHLVPTYLLVDDRGRVVKKLVGFKTREEIEAALDDPVIAPLT